MQHRLYTVCTPTTTQNATELRECNMHCPKVLERPRAWKHPTGLSNLQCTTIVHCKHPSTQCSHVLRENVHMYSVPTVLQHQLPRLFPTLHWAQNDYSLQIRHLNQALCPGLLIPAHECVPLWHVQLLQLGEVPRCIEEQLIVCRGRQSAEASPCQAWDTPSMTLCCSDGRLPASTTSFRSLLGHLINSIVFM